MLGKAKRSLSPEETRLFCSWTRFTAAIVFAICPTAICGTFASAALHEGEGFIRGGGGGWDFSTFSYLEGDDGINSDIFLAVVAFAEPAQGEILAAFGLSGVQYAPVDVEFDSLSIAPDSGYVYGVVADQGRCYFVRTKESQYAKIQLLLYDGYTWPFRYVYQDDGSTVLPVAESTWGKLKELYRSE